MIRFSLTILFLMPFGMAVAANPLESMIQQDIRQLQSLNVRAYSLNVLL